MAIRPELVLELGGLVKHHLVKPNDLTGEELQGEPILLISDYEVLHALNQFCHHIKFDLLVFRVVLLKWNLNVLVRQLEDIFLVVVAHVEVARHDEENLIEQLLSFSLHNLPIRDVNWLEKAEDCHDKFIIQVFGVVSCIVDLSFLLKKCVLARQGFN